MRSDKVAPTTAQQPQTRNELQAWVRDRLTLPPALEAALLTAIDAVFTRHERLWQESKQEAIQALSAGFADKMARVTDRAVGARTRRSAASRATSKQLVADLTDKSHRDPKTKLMNFAPLHRAARVVSRARAARPLVRGRPGRYHRVQVVQRRARPRGRRSDHRARRARCCASRCGRTICWRRSGPSTRSQDLHARFGGDEFCFLIPDLAEYQQALRRRRALPRGGRAVRLDASRITRLAAQPVRVDVGVVCLWLGRVADRRFIARRLAADLIQRADKLMYEAKGERANHIYLLRARSRTAIVVDCRPTIADRAPPDRRPSHLRATLEQLRQHGGCSSMVRAPVCGTGGCGFESRHPPQLTTSIQSTSLRRRLPSPPVSIQQPNRTRDGGRTEVPVPLRSPEILMPRRLLDRTSRRPTHGQMGAEGVSEHVNAVARHARPPRRPTNGAVDHLGERPSSSGSP